ncbi:MAG: cellulase family glycosylhydrolase, partial [Anaerolineae bacterium]
GTHLLTVNSHYCVAFAAAEFLAYNCAIRNAMRLKDTYYNFIRTVARLLLVGLVVALLSLPVANAQRESPSSGLQEEEYQLYFPVLQFNNPYYKIFLPFYHLSPQEASVQHASMQSMQKPSGFVQRVGEDLQLDGQPYTFVGTNVSYLAGPFFPEVYMEEIVSFLANSGVQVIRVWTEPWCDMERVVRLVDLAGKYNVRLILTLQNFFGHKDGWWFKSKAETVDLPHIRNIVPLFANRPEVLMWELMNEPTCPAEDANPSCWNAFVRWAEVTSGEIKRLDPNHLVAVGTQHAGFDDQALDAFRRVHALDTIDIISVHWNVGGTPQKELDIARELGKPVYLGETYMLAYDKECHLLSDSILEERAQAVAHDIERSRQLGIDGYLLWQYIHDGCGVTDYLPTDPVWQVIRSVSSSLTR